jgi:hypothetical protein
LDEGLKSGRDRFNRTFRHELLDAYVFESLSQVREALGTGRYEVSYFRKRTRECCAVAFSGVCDDANGFAHGKTSVLSG